MLFKIYVFGILLNIITQVIVVIDIEIFKHQCAKEDYEVEVDYSMALWDILKIFLPIYNILVAFTLFFNIQKIKQIIFAELHEGDQSK